MVQLVNGPVMDRREDGAEAGMRLERSRFLLKADPRVFLGKTYRLLIANKSRASCLRSGMAFVLYAPNIKSGINGGIGIKSHGQRVNGPIRESDLGRPRDKRGA